MEYILTRGMTQIDNTAVTVYGIKYSEGEIADISSEKEAVEAMIECLNTNEVSQLHVRDVIEDLIAQ